MRLRTIVTCVGCALGATACGSAGSSSASRPQPPDPVNLSALMSDSHVAVSPARIGAGPVLLVVTNQGRRAQALVLRRRAGATGRTLARTAPINPQGATQLSVDLRRGDYELSLAARGPRRTDAQRSHGAPATPGATLRVGRSRGSGGGTLLSP